ncbi:hypothetical protein, partial [uncultured Agitococcus sp.]|uniref:hypothetical protein n=1 Tax=uncultured Agitococcus sp. TaxID=1506599 RepID=UPI00262FBD31
AFNEAKANAPTVSKSDKLAQSYDEAKTKTMEQRQSESRAANEATKEFLGYYDGQVNLKSGNNPQDSDSKPKFSQSSTIGDRTTTSQVRQTLVNRFGEKLIKTLEDKGILRIVDSVKDIAEGALKSIKAYHGSPANFDRFMREFVNSGEGAQAFGWGHYLAGRKALADWYRSVLSNDAARTQFIFRKDGQRIKLSNLYKAPNFASPVSEETLVKVFKEYLLGEYNRRTDTWEADENPRYDALEKINKDILEYTEDTSGYVELNAVKQILEQYKAKKFSAQRTSTSHKGTGQLYEVDIAAKEESFIDWFAKFDNLPTTEQEALLAIFKKFDTYRNLDTEGKTVGQLYQQVTRYSRDGLPKELSLALKELGYSGIKFLDQESRSRPYEKQYYNYVVFDENIITIKDRHYSQNNSDVEGYYHNGQVTLVADNLTDESIIPTFVHELGGHKGFQEMMSPKAYAIIMAVFDRLVAQGNPIAVAAKKRAQQAEDSQDRQTDEYIPYFLTEQEKAHQATKAQRNAV